MKSMMIFTLVIMRIHNYFHSSGQIDQGNLFEFLHYNSFNIEIHDRDRKLPDTAK